MAARNGCRVRALRCLFTRASCGRTACPICALAHTRSGSRLLASVGGRDGEILRGFVVAGQSAGHAGAGGAFARRDALVAPCRAGGAAGGRGTGRRAGAALADCAGLRAGRAVLCGLAAEHHQRGCTHGAENTLPVCSRCGHRSGSAGAGRLHDATGRIAGVPFCVPGRAVRNRHPDLPLGRHRSARDFRHFTAGPSRTGGPARRGEPRRPERHPGCSAGPAARRRLRLRYLAGRHRCGRSLPAGAAPAGVAGHGRPHDRRRGAGGPAAAGHVDHPGRRIHAAGRLVTGRHRPAPDQHALRVRALAR